MPRDFSKLVVFLMLSNAMCLRFVSDLHHPLERYPITNSQPSIPETSATFCYSNKNWNKCPQFKYYLTTNPIIQRYGNDYYKNTLRTSHIARPLEYNTQSFFRGMFTPKPDFTQQTDLPIDGVHLSLQKSVPYLNVNEGIKMANPYYSETTNFDTNQLNTEGFVKSNITSEHSSYSQTFKSTPTAVLTNMNIITLPNNITTRDDFMEGLHRFERNFYVTTFKNLLSISPEDRKENGMSFVQSSILLYLTLMGLSTEADVDTKTEIENCIGYRHSDLEKVELIRHVMSSLPNTSDEIKFRRSSRLLFGSDNSNNGFNGDAFEALDLQVESIDTAQEASEIANVLNHMVETDSGGSIHKTFEENELTGTIRAILLTTVYFRASWQSAPTVLNGTRIFHDFNGANNRSVRMIRINDCMKYGDLKEWDAEALEINYAEPGLSFLMLIPRGRSLRNLTNMVGEADKLKEITDRMKTVRVAATLPLYTLRMTLLLPNKLQAMGISRLVDTTDASDKNSLRLSHAVQRLMFWAEAGRNAFKDDGIEWDQHPEMEIVVDRPYIFFVRWHNLTLINGNFVL